MKNRKGFTLAELLIVVAIIGVLVAVSIPIFIAQLDKAKIATNKANMRAARASASVQFYEDLGDGNLGGVACAYYKYDITTGTITESSYSSEGGGTAAGDSAGRKCRESGAKNGIYQYIMVYVSETDKEGGASIQTAPYYDDNDKIYTGTNPYGPYAGK